MIGVYKFVPDRLRKILSEVELELGHIHLAEKGDKWSSKFNVHKTYEFCFVLSGKGIYCREGKNFNVESGDLFIAKPGQRHYETCDLVDPCELIFITVKVCKKGKEFTLDKIFKLPSRVHVVPEKRICVIFQNMLDEVILRRPGYMLKIKSHLVDLLVEIYRFLYVKQKTFSGAKMIDKTRKKKLIIGICEYIQVNYSKKVGLVEISNEFHLAPQYLSALFKKQIGYSLIEYLTKIKIDMAKKMLKNSEMKISSIALDVGYESPHYFHRMFKKIVGVTPTQYREKV